MSYDFARCVIVCCSWVHNSPFENSTQEAVQSAEKSNNLVKISPCIWKSIPIVVNTTKAFYLATEMAVRLTCLSTHRKAFLLKPVCRACSHSGGTSHNKL